ncbi:MAG: sugar transferase [SAR324 cluster bacterium]|uniref:Sugar transferase n=1 Tax=SAR324 cluster bacterium TaxID=2024889 RepID=A0A2A4T597_9DELT|nr:MAG: sugar transferase [SAR324 cluster bacterium]
MKQSENPILRLPQEGKSRGITELPTTIMITQLAPRVLLAKRILDVVGALVALILLSWVILLTGIAVKLTSSGPVFFRQQRIGKDGKIFNLIKFRSMKVNAEAITGPIWAQEGKGQKDPRVTPIGNFLRKAHLDEFPQFFLVLKGEMSLIGPRPERPEFLRELSERYPFYGERYMHLKPGITGIAQMRREHDESLRKTANKLIADHTYGILLSQLGPLRVCLLDIKILLVTIKNILF